MHYLHLQQLTTEANFQADCDLDLLANNINVPVAELINVATQNLYYKKCKRSFAEPFWKPVNLIPYPLFKLLFGSNNQRLEAIVTGDV